jgi:uncharacterized cupin superfamily protein
MEHVDIEDVEPRFFAGEDVDRRALTDALNATDLAINYYRLEPEQSLSGGMHAHMDQEEVFYVVEGTVTFETPDAEHAVGPNEAIRFAPGEYQTSENRTDDDAVVLALGAPKGSTDVRVPMACRECGDADSLQFVMTGDGQHLECPECGNVVEMD